MARRKAKGPIGPPGPPGPAGSNADWNEKNPVSPNFIIDHVAYQTGSANGSGTLTAAPAQSNWLLIDDGTNDIIALTGFKAADVALQNNRIVIAPDLTHAVTVQGSIGSEHILLADQVASIHLDGSLREWISVRWDDATGQWIQDGGKGVFSQNGTIVPITEAALVALIGSFDPTVIYLVTDAGSTVGQLGGGFAQIYVRAYNSNNLNPECNGQFQNSVMSAPVLFSGQYTLDGGQPYIAQVQTTMLNNKWSVQKNNPNFAFDRLSLDLITFDNTNTYDNVFQNFSILSKGGNIGFESSTFKNMAIDLGGTSGTSFIHHWQEGSYSTEITISGNNCYFQYNTLHFQRIIDMGNNCGVVGTTSNDGAFSVWEFNSHANCFIDFCDFGFNNDVVFEADNTFIAESIIGEDNFIDITNTILRITADCNAQIYSDGGLIDLCNFGSQSYTQSNTSMYGSDIGQDANVTNCGDISYCEFMQDSYIDACGNITLSIFEPDADVENNVDISNSSFKLGCFVHDNQQVIIESTFEQDCEVSNNLRAIIECNFEKECLVHDNQQALISSNFGQDCEVHDNLQSFIETNIGQGATVTDNAQSFIQTNIYQEADVESNLGIIISCNIYQSATVKGSTGSLLESNFHVGCDVENNGLIIESDIYQLVSLVNFATLIKAIFEKECTVNGNGFSFINTFVAQNKTFTALSNHSDSQWDLESSNFELTLDVTGIGTNNVTPGDGQFDMGPIGIGLFNTGTVVGVIAQGSTIDDGAGNIAVVMGIDYFTGVLTIRSYVGQFTAPVTLDDNGGNTIDLLSITYGTANYLGKILLHSNNTNETITKLSTPPTDHDVQLSADNLNQMLYISKNPATVTQSEFNLKNGANVTLQGYNGFSDFIVLRRAFNAGGGIEFSREINNSIL